LTHSPHEPLALNALWALKNLTFHALDSMKTQVIGIFGWDSLRRHVILVNIADASFIGAASSPVLRVQAFEIMQNLLADATAPELSRYVENIGEGYLLDVLSIVSREGMDAKLRVPVSASCRSR